MVENEPRGVLDTCTFIDYGSLDRERLPDIVELTSVTMAELHQGIVYAKTHESRGARLERLSKAVTLFEPLPFNGEAAGRFGTMVALTIDNGRSPKQRSMDLMIAAIASVHELPLYTRNPKDFMGLESLVRVIAV